MCTHRFLHCLAVNNVRRGITEYTHTHKHTHTHTHTHTHHLFVGADFNLAEQLFLWIREMVSAPLANSHQFSTSGLDCHNTALKLFC